MLKLLWLFSMFYRDRKLAPMRRPGAAKAVLAGLVDGHRGLMGIWMHHDRDVWRAVGA
jgi:hypothetical protein